MAKKRSAGNRPAKLRQKQSTQGANDRVKGRTTEDQEKKQTSYDLGSSKTRRLAQLNNSFLKKKIPVKNTNGPLKLLDDSYNVTFKWKGMSEYQDPDIPSIQDSGISRNPTHSLDDDHQDELELSLLNISSNTDKKSQLDSLQSKIIRRRIPIHRESSGIVDLLTNSYKIIFKSRDVMIHQYELTIKRMDFSPSFKIAQYPKLRENVYKVLIKEGYLTGDWAFDGRKKLYTNDVWDDIVDSEIKLGRKSYSVSVRLTPMKAGIKDVIDALRVDGAVVPRDPIIALNVIFLHCLKSMPNRVAIKRSVHSPEQQGSDLPRNLRLWSGVCTNVTPTSGFDITVRMLKKHEVIIPGGHSLLAFIKSENINIKLGDNTLSDEDRRELSILLKGLKVTPIYSDREKNRVIKCISKENALFYLENCKANLEDLFKNLITKRKLNCVELLDGKLIPMELLNVVRNQPYYRDLDASLQRDVIRKACIKPRELRSAIHDEHHSFKHTLDQSLASKLGISVDRTPISIKGTVLQSPLYNSKRIKNGEFRMGLVGESSWMKLKIISMVKKDDYNESAHDKLTEALLDTSRSLGMHIDENFEVSFCRQHDLKSHLSPDRLNIIIDRNLDYGRIKLEECSQEVRTQCLDWLTVRKKIIENNDRNTLVSILLKMNVKCGGLNWTLECDNLPPTIFSEPVMILGATVTHFNDGRPSIASVVASCSKSFLGAGSDFLTEISVQYPTKNRRAIEHIVDMKNITVNLLGKFYKNTSGVKPAKIIYYRDGVSINQFETIILEELYGIQEACTSLETCYKPKISIVVCTKRHDQRFMKKEGDKTIGNPSPGTVVCDGVTAPNYENFYLFSQKGIQGTSIPCHYYVLYDDSKFSANFWHTFTYYLCLTYARCTKSVSYPAPVYYAHLACKSARSRFLASPKYSRAKWTSVQARPSADDVAGEITPRRPGFMFYI